LHGNVQKLWQDFVPKIKPFCVLNRTGAGRAVTHIINRSVQNYWFRNNVWWSWTRGGAEAPGAFTKDVEEYNQSEYCRLAGDVYGLVLSTLSSEEEEESAFTKMDLKKRAARYRMLLCQHL
jgi:hypothetical protein